MFRSPLFYAALSFVGAFVIIGFVIPELACMDGWQSPSVGRSGACSHHGGVNETPVFIGLMISVAIAFFVWKNAKKHEARLASPDNKIIEKVEQSSANIFSALNLLTCRVWNVFIRFLMRLGLGKAFDKSPIITVIGCFIVVAIFPPVMSVLFVLGLVAYLNGASPATSYLVPDKEV